ncbi:MAG: PD40 domain-containing protein, partial [Deltaproteobacteria bacterium]|nr:PD40 domain-containing protein [Deltaproteobacteria bacterium]
MWRARVIVLLALAGCYQAAPGTGAPCDERAICPTGQSCFAGRCQVGDGPATDAAADGTGLIDAAIIVDAPDGTPLMWSAPVVIPGVNSSSAESDPTMSADRLTIVFTRSNELFIGTRASTGASFTVTALTAANSPAAEHSPELSPDGSILHFTSDRLVATDDDIYVSTRVGGGAFSAPTRVEGLSTTTSKEGDIAISPDGLTAVIGRSGLFRSVRPSITQPWPAAVAIATSFGVNPAAPSINTAGDLYFHAGIDRNLFV